MAITIIMLD